MSFALFAVTMSTCWSEWWIWRRMLKPELTTLLPSESATW